ncbi:FAD-dependent monooxygenase [Nakamurella sp. YIM 132087]|uniref:FAD-dependent monooxygenase n=1 Tax=Nakamurella alba TaxID=2665158 RepID=A0A7K1FPS8_9ACTN|nr:FAD-dependent monooxygenase [Nakamurella alba]MTD14824.1 FAD-dependent monooxygenase [Nakamurella alba]
MRALIMGAGIAGPAGALALHRIGIDAVILERRPAPAAGDPLEGSYLTLAPNGVDVLDTLGVLGAVRECGVPTRANIMIGATGRPLGELPLGAARPDGLVGLTVQRTRLAQVLTDAAVARGTDIRYGAEVVQRQERPDGVSVVLSDGTELSADLLVGADGVRSATRSAIDPNAPAARYVGLTNFGGITTGSPLAGSLTPAAWHFVFGARCFTGLLPTPGGDVVWFVNVPGPQISRAERAATPAAAWLDRLVELAAPDAGPAAEVIRAGRLELAADNTFDLGHVPMWWRGRSVLVGDAAHAPSPSSGQGASMALEDAVVLAQALRDHPDPAAAFAAYERARRTRVEKIVAVGARSGSAKIPGRIGRRFREAGMRFAFRRIVTPERMAWMTDHRIDWDAPGWS